MKVKSIDFLQTRIKHIARRLGLIQGVLGALILAAASAKDPCMYLRKMVGRAILEQF